VAELRPEDFGAVPVAAPTLNPADFGAVPIQRSALGAPKKSRPLTNDNPNVIDKWILDTFGSKLARMPDIQGTKGARFVQGMADIPVGGMQLAANAVGLGDQVNPVIAETNQRTEQLRGPDAGFDWMRLAGNVVNPIPFKAASSLAPATGIAGRMAQGSLIGAGTGAASPVTKEGDFLGDKLKQIMIGGLVGGSIPAVTGSIGAGLTTARNVIDPWLKGGTDRAAGRTIDAALGDNRDKVIQALQQSQSLVPGSKPTAAEAAANVGSATLSGLERAVKGRRPDEAVAIEKANEAARRAAVSKIAGSGQDIENAAAMRSGNASVNYGAVSKDVIKPDSELAKLLERPSMSGVMKRASDLAKENAEQFVAKNDAGKVTGLPVKSLHYVKMAMDDLVKNPERFGIGASEARAIGETQKSFVSWLGAKSPGYNEARARFAVDSDPINRMQVGQVLEKAITSPLGGAERASTFANAVREAPQTIKKATGNPRFEKLEQILTAREMQSVKGVVDDLARVAENDRLAQAGASKANDLVGLIVPKLPAGGMFNPKYSVTRAIGNRFAGLAEGKSMDRLAQALETPEGALQVMAAAGIKKSRADTVVEALLKQAARNAAVMSSTQGEK
jgi:hypothetical protein